MKLACPEAGIGDRRLPLHTCLRLPFCQCQQFGWDAANCVTALWNLDSQFFLFPVSCHPGAPAVARDMTVTSVLKTLIFAPRYGLPNTFAHCTRECLGLGTAAFQGFRNSAPK